jgi:flagellar hook-basal body protein
MGLSNSLYASISGLNTMGSAMSVLGDNVSNVNTIAFKSSRATFQDVLSQNMATASGIAQVGRGVTITTVDGLFAQGSFESTSSPTDLAIGGQGFFMLRAAESAQADMYTRAGEFRFDREGFLINPSGYFVQGWSIDSRSGERQGTIGDIYLGKSTPPVETSRVQVIANVDSRISNEVNELRLFDAWDGRNPSLPVPAPPIDANAYEYTTSLKVYDSQGAAHDITVYFDRTTLDNQWEFLVTCNPADDRRVLSSGLDALNNLDGSNDELSIYTPDTTYNYLNHKGAGALMYGVIDFSTNGAIDNIWAWNVPPDGEVDPAQNTNRLVLSNTDQYYSFAANFTGATVNQMIELNLGARYSGQATAVSQVLVSDSGAYANSGATLPITRETLWQDVFDSTGTQVDITTPATVTFAGYDNDGTAVSGSYTLQPTEKVQKLLDAMGATFNATATIDAAGRIKLTDKTGGASGMAVTSFSFSSGVNPFGSQINISTSKTQVVSSERALNNASGAEPVITANTLLTNVYDTAGNNLVLGDTMTFVGTSSDGTLVNATYVAGSTVSGVGFGPPLVAPTGTVQDLLTWLEDQFNAEASIDGAGRLVLTDRRADEVATGGYTSQLEIASIAYSGAAEPFGTGTFDTILADATGEDGSRAGQTVSIDFVTEALSTTQYANSSTTIFQDQDGFAAGFLQSVSVDTSGVITGNYSNGQVLKKAQVALASFNNLAGLFKEGGNIFRETTESGAPVTGAAGTNGLGTIAPNSLEQSNVDLGTEFVKLITTQRGFQANSKVITTTDEMLGDLINIKR